MAVTLGMTGTGRWTNEERPKRFREGMLFLEPNGDTPLTAVQSKGRSRKVDDPEFKWYSKNLQAQSGATAGIYTTSGLSVAVADNAAITAGTTVYAKVAEAVADHFRAGHTVRMVDDADETEDAFGKCTAVVKNGASSYLAVKILKAVATNEVDWTDIDTVDCIGNVNAEGANIPDAISYEASKYSNYTQIFRTPLDITRTQRRTRLRIGDAYKELKRESLQYHGVEMEMAAIFGEDSENTGDNGQPERTTQGMVSFTKENASANVLDFIDQAATWASAGEDWLDESLEVLFRYGGDSRLCLCGSGALLGIQKLVKATGQFNFTSMTASYGIKITEWVTPFGVVYLKRHPLFSHRSHLRNAMLLYEPENVQFSYIDDTFFKSDTSMKEGGRIAYDGTKEEFITEGGYEFHFPETFMYLTNVGVDGA